MKQRVCEIINKIRIDKDLDPLEKIEDSDLLRDRIGFTSFDLATLTVLIEDEFGVDIFEDGLVSSVGEIYSKLG
ncbi:MAG: phosphopantetheine-binding protein [Bacteroidales bacterium]